ncbi:MAG: thioredoxin family protein [Zoogloeaceae bacterium]|nr:thioredoxin family protein [Zoogloeaceae bacterium]
MLDIKILGPGCANCKQLEELTRNCAEELGVPTRIEKVTDYADILTYDILSTPGLVVNGKVVSSGRIPAPGSITAWLQEAAAAGG